VILKYSLSAFKNWCIKDGAYLRAVDLHAAIIVDNKM